MKDVDVAIAGTFQRVGNTIRKQFYVNRFTFNYYFFNSTPNTVCQCRIFKAKLISFSFYIAFENPQFEIESLQPFATEIISFVCRANCAIVACIKLNFDIFTRFKVTEQSVNSQIRPNEELQVTDDLVEFVANLLWPICCGQFANRKKYFEYKHVFAIKAKRVKYLALTNLKLKYIDDFVIIND